MGWRARLLWSGLWLLGRLPLSWLHALGRGLGRLSLRRHGRSARIAERNLQLCLPELPPAERVALLRAALEQTGCSLTELAYLWTRPPASVLARVRLDGSAALLQAAREDGRPLIIAAPHLGAWELLNLWLCAQMPLAVLYRPPRQRWLEGLLNHARRGAGAEPVAATRQGVRRLVTLLRQGVAVGILPDQQPKQGEGEFAPFFGQPALTMTLLPKLVQRTAAQVIYAWAERLPHGAGWMVRLRAAAAPPTDVATLNAQIEQCARELPAQYQWTYKRFSIAPPGGQPRY